MVPRLETPASPASRASLWSMVDCLCIHRICSLTNSPCRIYGIDRRESTLAVITSSGRNFRYYHLYSLSFIFWSHQLRSRSATYEFPIVGYLFGLVCRIWDCTTLYCHDHSLAAGLIILHHSCQQRQSAYNRIYNSLLYMSTFFLRSRRVCFEVAGQ